jgi:hypothetical protein
MRISEMDIKKSAAQVWKEIEAVLRHRVPEDERLPWQPFITAYIEKRLSWDELTYPIREIWADRRPSREIEEILKSSQPAPSIKGTTRTNVLEEIVAAHATRDPEVTQFRQEVLGGALLKEHEIHSWITQEQEKERERPAIFLDAVPLPPNHDIRDVAHRGIVPDPPISVGEEHPAGSMRVDILEYATPESHRARYVPVAHGGVLARLHHLSTTLAQRYSWQPGQATAFVLTGLPPDLRTIDATWGDLTFFQTQTGSVTALNRLVLTIDPTLSPKEVHNYFQSIRQRLLGAKWRDLKENQLELARFTIHCNQEEPWPQRMAAWNTEFPQWSYKEDLGHFRRDCQNAIKKLLAPIPLTIPFFPQSEGNDAKAPRQL